MQASAVVSFTNEELAAAADVLRALAATPPPGPAKRNRRRPVTPIPVRRQPRDLASGQYIKCQLSDPYGTPLPPGVCWNDGIDPGYAVEVQSWGQSVSLVVPYRLYPGPKGVRVALALKDLLVSIRETVPADCIERFAGAVMRMAEP